MDSFGVFCPLLPWCVEVLAGVENFAPLPSAAYVAILWLAVAGSRQQRLPLIHCLAGGSIRAMTHPSLMGLSIGSTVSECC